MSKTDAQFKWEMIALNAIEHAARFNLILAKIAQEPFETGKPIDPYKILGFVRDNQIRLSRDLRDLRKLTQQREREQE